MSSGVACSLVPTRREGVNNVAHRLGPAGFGLPSEVCALRPVGGGVRYASRDQKLKLLFLGESRPHQLQPQSVLRKHVSLLSLCRGFTNDAMERCCVSLLRRRRHKTDTGA